jgi:DNA repair exonuclease SbcCD ATPase subunit
MRVRHRIPSIFNLSMVDVLCCALGCVILIWLINLRESKQHEEQAGSLLQKKESEIAELERLRDDLNQKTAAQADAVHGLEEKLKDAYARTESLRADLEKRGKELADARAGTDDLTHKLADAAGRIKTLQALADMLPTVQSDLKKSQDQYAADEAKLLKLQKDLAQRGVDLDDALRKLLAAQKDATTRAQDLDDAGKKLADLLAAKAKLQADLTDRDKELSQLRPYRDKFAADEEMVLALRKDLADARRGADALQTESAKWRNEAARVQAEVENRFAGITLTGKRVVFLVDMSGSMDYIDDNTKAPEKWLGVHNTVAKIMRSLPELEKFQLITFSDKSHFPLGNDGKWLDYDPKTGPDLVLKTLAAVQPDGGTNMYTPMQSAFAFRAQGLDTIYLMSDGLPNLGEGVTPQEVKALSEEERGFRLGQIIRKKLKTDWNRELDGKPRVHINTVGFFYESPDVGAFLWALARENDGSFVGMSKP